MPPLLPAPAEGTVLALLFYWHGNYHRNHFGNGMREPGLDAFMVVRCRSCKGVLFASVNKGHVIADHAADIAEMVKDNGVVEWIEGKEELKRTDFGCKCFKTT